jgi:hypothetical protein
MGCGSDIVPYYIGEGMPEWEEYLQEREAGRWEPPVSLFTYIKPWEAETTVLPFPETPGLEPEIPQRTDSQENWLENYTKWQKAASAHALWQLSGLTATCRALGVKRVFGSYDGGGDEGFVYYRDMEMSDGRMITEEQLRKIAEDVDYHQIVGNAVFALMGIFDAGPFVLHGVVTIDFDACTITDEKNADVVLGGKKPWEV